MDITKLVSSLFWTLSEYQGETGFHQSLQSEEAKQVLNQADLTEKKLLKGSAVLLQANHQQANDLQAADLQATGLQRYKSVWVAAVKGSVEGVTELKQFGRHKTTHNRISGSYKTLQDDSGSVQRSQTNDVVAVLRALQYAVELKFTWHELQDAQHRMTLLRALQGQFATSVRLLQLSESDPSFGLVIDDLDWQDLAVTDALEAYQSFRGHTGHQLGMQEEAAVVEQHHLEAVEQYLQQLLLQQQQQQQKEQPQLMHAQQQQQQQEEQPQLMHAQQQKQQQQQEEQPQVMHAQQQQANAQQVLLEHRSTERHQHQQQLQQQRLQQQQQQQSLPSMPSHSAVVQHIAATMSAADIQHKLEDPATTAVNRQCLMEALALQQHQQQQQQASAAVVAGAGLKPVAAPATALQGCVAAAAGGLAVAGTSTGAAGHASGAAAGGTVSWQQHLAGPAAAAAPPAGRDPRLAARPHLARSLPAQHRAAVMPAAAAAAVTDPAAAATIATLEAGMATGRLPGTAGPAPAPYIAGIAKDCKLCRHHADTVVWTGYVTWEFKDRSLSGRFKACGHLFKPKEIADDGGGSYWARYKALQGIELHFVVDLPVVKQDGNQLNAGFETGPWAAPPQDPDYHTISQLCDGWDLAPLVLVPITHDSVMQLQRLMDQLRSSPSNKSLFHMARGRIDVTVLEVGRSSSSNLGELGSGGGDRGGSSSSSLLRNGSGSARVLRGYSHIPFNPDGPLLKLMQHQLPERYQTCFDPHVKYCQNGLFFNVADPVCAVATSWFRVLPGVKLGLSGKTLMEPDPPAGVAAAKDVAEAFAEKHGLQIHQQVEKYRQQEQQRLWQERSLLTGTHSLPVDLAAVVQQQQQQQQQQEHSLQGCFSVPVPSRLQAAKSTVHPSHMTASSALNAAAAAAAAAAAPRALVNGGGGRQPVGGALQDPQLQLEDEGAAGRPAAAGPPGQQAGAAGAVRAEGGAGEEAAAAAAITSTLSDVLREQEKSFLALISPKVLLKAQQQVKGDWQLLLQLLLSAQRDAAETASNRQQAAVTSKSADAAMRVGLRKVAKAAVTSDAMLEQLPPALVAALERHLQQQQQHNHQKDICTGAIDAPVTGQHVHAVQGEQGPAVGAAIAAAASEQVTELAMTEPVAVAAAVATTIGIDPAFAAGLDKSGDQQRTVLDKSSMAGASTSQQQQQQSKALASVQHQDQQQGHQQEMPSKLVAEQSSVQEQQQSEQPPPQQQQQREEDTGQVEGHLDLTQLLPPSAPMLPEQQQQPPPLQHPQQARTQHPEPDRPHRQQQQPPGRPLLRTWRDLHHLLPQGQPAAAGLPNGSSDVKGKGFQDDGVNMQLLGVAQPISVEDAMRQVQQQAAAIDTGLTRPSGAGADRAGSNSGSGTGRGQGSGTASVTANGRSRSRSRSLDKVQSSQRRGRSPRSQPGVLQEGGQRGLLVTVGEKRGRSRSRSWSPSSPVAAAAINDEVKRPKQPPPPLRQQQQQQQRPASAAWLSHMQLEPPKLLGQIQYPGGLNPLHRDELRTVALLLLAAHALLARHQEESSERAAAMTAAADAAAAAAATAVHADKQYSKPEAEAFTKAAAAAARRVKVLVGSGGVRGSSSSGAAAGGRRGSLVIARQPRVLLEGQVDVKSDLVLPDAWMPKTCSLEAYADSKKRCGLFCRDRDRQLKVVPNFMAEVILKHSLLTELLLKLLSSLRTSRGPDEAIPVQKVVEVVKGSSRYRPLLLYMQLYADATSFLAHVLATKRCQSSCSEVLVREAPAAGASGGGGELAEVREAVLVPRSALLSKPWHPKVMEEVQYGPKAMAEP